MALQKCGLNLNREFKELKPHGSPRFPCAGYSSCYRERQEDMIPWHWHEEMEMVYLEKGQMEIKIPSGRRPSTTFAGVFQGTMVTLQPRWLSCRPIPCFMPQSMATT